ncbi:hypothetical protein GCM10010964_36660 [Caldovatus sediminis]|uniref:Uncharacterized protein n=1 Tax=Caldovatus sediminis TaxID=2041189 RepID=A0A8J3ECF1_9PROT|nr:hypothetical protein GCM10010964_36660 [Caldovatus sediminis]
MKRSAPPSVRGARGRVHGWRSPCAPMAAARGLLAKAGPLPVVTRVATTRTARSMLPSVGSPVGTRREASSVAPQMLPADAVRAALRDAVAGDAVADARDPAGFPGIEADQPARRPAGGG